MTAKAAKIRTAPKSAELLGIDAPEGFHCQDCDRELTARLFRVRVTATGEVRYLGRKCAARATGYPTTRLEHEAKRAEELRRWEIEVATTWTAEQLADHFRAVVVCTAEDTLEVWDAAGEIVTRPVAEHAAVVLAGFRAKHGA